MSVLASKFWSIFKAQVFFFFFPSNPLWSPNIFISYFDKTVGTISIPLIISPKMLNSCGLFIFLNFYLVLGRGFPDGSDGEDSVYNARYLGLIPGSGRSPGEGNGYSLQYSYLENSMDRRTWRATVYRVTKIQTRLTLVLFVVN